MNTLFTFGLLIAAVVVIVAVIGAIYVAVGNRRELDREEASPTAGATDAAPASREFYMRLGLETDEEMKLRLYSLDEYVRDLGGDDGAFGHGQFLGALKAYRQIDEDWYDYPPHKASEVLELAPEDYEVDGERSVLLLKRFPRGLPTSARDVQP